MDYLILCQIGGEGCMSLMQLSLPCDKGTSRPFLLLLSVASAALAGPKPGAIPGSTKQSGPTTTKAPLEHILS